MSSEIFLAKVTIHVIHVLDKSMGMSLHIRTKKAIQLEYTEFVDINKSNGGSQEDLVLSHKYLVEYFRASSWVAGLLESYG